VRNGWLRSLEVTLLEQNFRGYARGHATLLHPASLRMLAELGLSVELLAAGRPIDCVKLYFDGNHAVTFELPLPALAIPQSVFEEILLKALRKADVELLSPCEASMISQNADQCTCAPRGVNS
jgi:2-polyprenyl-6-methoxyphenol hydroxylase-like FAD-dependent oxidoreductase